jgi:hypothetical protein
MRGGGTNAFPPPPWFRFGILSLVDLRQLVRPTGGSAVAVDAMLDSRCIMSATCEQSKFVRTK